MRTIILLTLMLSVSGCITSGDMPKREAEPKEAAKANLQLGSEYLQRGDRERALEKLQRAIEQDPGLAIAHAYLGLTYQQLGQHDEADTHYRQAIRIADDEPSVYNMYAVYLCRRDRLKEADRYFMAATKIASYNTPEAAYTNAGVCQLKVPNVEKAENYFRQALDLNPRYPDALWQMAQLTYAEGRDFQSRAFLQRLTEVARLSSAALWLGYRVETDMGDDDAAAQYARQLMDMFPESVEAAELSQVDPRY
ncbi:MAG: type IV pilus biogenesis/stability protein PilW [Gammaproteobacteria bacterium]|nr:type IV pilus biogenesis/stability protein PilW [Gammaproteobacteria bacterium]